MVIIMIIVERDIKLLEDMYFVKYLNSKKIAKLFGNYDSAMRRLNQLKVNNYIKQVDFLINREIVWGLNRRGFNLLNRENYYISKTDKITHALACADFYFYLKQHGNKIQCYELDQEIKYKYQGKKYKFRPDIILYIDRWYFVEIDLSNRRFEEKVIKWENYYHSQMFVGKFTLFPPIIIVSNNVDKVKNAIDQTKTVDLSYVYKDYRDVADFQFKY